MIIVFLTSDSGVITSARLQWIYGWRRKGYRLLPNATQWLGFANRHKHSFRQWVWQSSSELAAVRLAVQVEVSEGLCGSGTLAKTESFRLDFDISYKHKRKESIFLYLFFTFSFNVEMGHHEFKRNHRFRSRILFPETNPVSVAINLVCDLIRGLRK